MNCYIVRVVPDDGNEIKWYGLFFCPLKDLPYFVGEYVSRYDCEYKVSFGSIMFKTKPDEDNENCITANFDNETEYSDTIWHDLNSKKGWKPLKICETSETRLAVSPAW